MTIVTTTTTSAIEQTVDEEMVAYARKQFINSVGGTKSAAVRYLLKEGYSRKQIAERLGMIYQHVRNIEVTPIKKQLVR